MFRIVGCSAAVAVLLAAGAGGQQVPVFRGTTETVPVYVTVTDKDSRLVTTLSRGDFLLFDNGKPQAVTLFDNTPQPVHLIVMLDVSGSMYGNLPLLQAACEQLFARLRPDDQARVGSFGEEIAISPTFTNDQAALNAAVPARIADNAPTPLWSALDAALDALAGVEGRRVVLVLSDGKDTGPVSIRKGFVSVIEVIDRAQRGEVMIYAVGMRSRSSARNRARNFSMGSGLLDDLPDQGLGTLALETGGGYFEIKPSDDLGAAFTRVVDELHSQYLLGFSPAARDGKRHKVEVRLVPRDLTPRARKNYMAPKGS